MVLRRIFGPRRDEIKGEWRRLHNEELNDLYSSPNIVRVIKSRRMRWAGHVARMGEERGAYRELVDIHVILYVNILPKFVEKIQVSLKSDQNNGYFAWRHMYIHDNIFNLFFRMRNV